MSLVVLNKGQRPRITAVDKKGSKTGWLLRFLVDATGRDTLLSASSDLSGSTSATTRRPCSAISAMSRAGPATKPE
jgi:hypothetical protein